jgi:hypothetical protein
VKKYSWGHVMASLSIASKLAPVCRSVQHLSFPSTSPALAWHSANYIKPSLTYAALTASQIWEEVSSACICTPAQGASAATPQPGFDQRAGYGTGG